jgi:hypothetical protein
MTACIHSFPLHRNLALVQQLADEVATASATDARDVMIERLGVHWDRLEALGVECDEIEYTIHALARKLWTHIGINSNNSPGAA